VQAVEMMNSVCGRAEQYLARGHHECLQHSEPELKGTESALIKAVHSIIHTDEIKAVAVFTMTGRTARLLAKMRLEVPVLALTPEQRVVQRACLFYGVQAERCETPRHTREVLAQAARHIEGLKWATTGQKIVVVSGRPLGSPGNTNTIVIHTI